MSIHVAILLLPFWDFSACSRVNVSYINVLATYLVWKYFHSATREGWFGVYILIAFYTSESITCSAFECGCNLSYILNNEEKIPLLFAEKK
jgi:hypothetical protein